MTNKHVIVKNYKIKNGYVHYFCDYSHYWWNTEQIYFLVPYKSGDSIWYIGDTLKLSLHE